ncbi:MAG: hypothetical protein H8E15_12455 [Planctomycetes bacterium]|nr:hypothetical protein [Planctomycetota bacterium]
MKKKFAEALKEYRKEVFKVEHDHNDLEQITKEALHITEEALSNAYRYHFHQLVDADRAEVINMVNNYTLEALLPPIVEKITKRQLLMERKLDLLVHLLEEALERISDNDA